MWPDLIPDPPQVNPPRWLYILTCATLITIIFAGIVSDWRHASKNRKRK